MSVLRASVGEAYYSVKRWYGVNENPDGDTNLKSGEAAVMRNFRVTDGGALKKRPGSAIVGGLMNGYSVHVGGDTITLFEDGESTKTFEMYPTMVADSVGEPKPSGEAVTVDASNWENYVGYYFVMDGKTVQFTGVTRTGADVIEKEGTFVVEGGQKPQYAWVFDAPPVFSDGVWDMSVGTYKKIDGFTEDEDDIYGIVGKYAIAKPGADGWDGTDTASFYDDYREPDSYEVNSDGAYLKITECLTDISDNDSSDLIWEVKYRAVYYKQTSYTWKFLSTYSSPNEAGTVVKALWSGYVGGTEYIVAACNHYLWRLSEEGGVWSKEEIGQINTDGKVCLFGFAGKLYCLDGSDYYVWDGAAFGSVSGYVPLVSVAAPPSGGGTLLERVNLLTAQRRQRFSPDGTAKEFYLAETNLASVDRVELNGAAVTDFTADTEAGIVTLSSAPDKATDNLEITYTAKESFRSRVTAMAFSELYNGVSDSRVFLYGDGSNVTLYSDLDEDGVATAEYFPDMNEIAVGDENTPLTALIRMYDRLMAYKEGSAWSIYYDTVTLSNGTVTAGFYCNSVNRSIGHDAVGQICLVENRPRTLDGRSIYEWKSSVGGSITNDQRNAERISQNVEATLAGFNLADALVFYDKINHEYYCVYDGTAVVQNVENGAWYVYTDIPATAMIVYKDELYFGGDDGYLRKLSDEYMSDDGAAIDAYWESGSMSFGKDYVEKHSPSVWVGLKQEESAAVTVGIETDRQEVITADVALSEDRDAMPRMNRTRLKSKKFTYYKLIFQSRSADTRCSVVAADVRVRYNINVK